VVLNPFFISAEHVADILLLLFRVEHNGLVLVKRFTLPTVSGVTFSHLHSTPPPLSGQTISPSTPAPLVTKITAVFSTPSKTEVFVVVFNHKFIKADVMEILKFRESNGVGKGSLGSYMDEPLEIGSKCNGEKEGVEDDILQDLDSYWQDVSDRFTISRIVAETVMMETAKTVFEEATGMVSSKELQVAQLQEELRLQCRACSKSNASNAVLLECLLEQEIQKEVQSLVMKECIVHFQEKEELGSGERNVEEVNWVEKFREFTILRQELESIHKSLSSLEYGH
ncbi:WPP domain-associated protein-like protein, partial [Drosera capensis]